ncbi:CPN2 [Mytilus coruscus]|uniref:CPN2 n=1 Tax=Mytilus coruscus TaxID=42192 RepID=A0A6J8CMU8_MYTCO|nr:CPN2 [Mytilus coruscus]
MLFIKKETLLCLLISTTITADKCPQPCTCFGLTVTCTRKGITEVPKDLPKETMNLNLNVNQISHIPKTAFQGLYQLKNLQLNGNQLNENSIEKGTLNLPTIETLDLSSNLFTSIPRELPPHLFRLSIFYNSITRLKENDFVNATSITYLYVNDNHISFIEEHTFDPLSSVIEISLNGNKLLDGSISRGIFMKNIKLTHLDLSINMLRTLPDMSFFPSSLTMLSILGNNITVIPSNAFKRLKNLTHLLLWEGAYTKLEDNAFNGLDNLYELDIADDNVSIITNKTFNGLDLLNTLWLSGNNISKIQNGTFNSLKNLKIFWLDFNKLVSLEPGVLDTQFLPHLVAVSITGNPWMCDCHLKWLREILDKGPFRIPDPHLVTCDGPAELAGKAWDDIKPSDFVCK